MNSHKSLERLGPETPVNASRAVGGAVGGRTAIPGSFVQGLDAGSPRSQRVALLAIVFCAAVALALRLWNLGDRPLWVDEAGTWGYASLDVASLVNVMGRVEPTPPSYYLLMKAWMALGDGSEFWLRLSSVAAGVASVPLFAAFLWRAFGPAAAAWGAALLAVAGGHVRYTQEARVYSVVFILFVLGLLLMERLVDALEATDRGRRWGFAAGLGATAGLMIHMHYSAAFAAATVYFYGLCLLIAQRRASVRRVAVLVASGAGGLLLAAPILWLALGLASGPSTGAYWVPPPGLEQAFFEFQSVLFAPQLHRLSLPGALLSLAALGVCFWAGRRHPQVMALAAAFFFAAFAFYAVSQAVPILMGRTVLFTLALTLAVLAHGLSKLTRPWLLAAVAAAAFVPQVKGSANQVASPNFYGEVWAEVAGRIGREAAPRDTVVVVGSFETIALNYYLAREGARRADAAVGDKDGGVNTLAIALMTDAVPIKVAELTEPLCKALRPDGGIWLVSRSADAYTEFTTHVRQGLQVSGAAERSRALHGGLIVERWSPPSRCG